MASMPMQPIDPDSRIAPSQLPYERGYAAGVAEMEAKYKTLVDKVKTFVECPCGSDLDHRDRLSDALRQLEVKP